MRGELLTSIGSIIGAAVVLAMCAKIIWTYGTPDLPKGWKPFPDPDRGER